MQTTAERKPKQRQRPALRTDPVRHGQALLATGDKQGALAAFMRAADAKPRDPSPHRQISALLTDLGTFDGAIGAAMTAVELAPADPMTHNTLAHALFAAGQAEAALPHCATAVLLAPKDLAAIITLSAILFSLGRHQEALDVGGQAVSIDPASFEAVSNLALALEAMGRLDEAEAQSRRALSLRPGSAMARHNLAALLLSRGQLDAEAWRLYDGRLELTANARAIGAVPRWHGADVAGRTVLLHAEQGLGDTIQFARFAPLVASRGARVIMAVQPSLVRLLQGFAGVDQVIAAGSPLPEFDVFCPLASLPGLFGTSLDTIPGRTPYLAATPSSIVRSPPSQRRAFQVGICWAGNPDFTHDRLRSIASSSLALLSDCPGAEFHSLQKGQPPAFPMQDRMGEVTDFADTAAIVAGLDLVIAVDTAVAHLAAAMGKEVWLLSRKMGCWRWLRDRTDSPWYPTMRIFRQSVANDWTSVLTDVRAALEVRVRKDKDDRNAEMDSSNPAELQRTVGSGDHGLE